MLREELGVREDIDAAFGEVPAGFDRATGRLRETYGRLTELSHAARSAVTVGPRGQVGPITMDPRVYRKLSPSEPADGWCNGYVEFVPMD
jgi:hypothetical protein